jgi:hypothetical protein
LRQIGEERLTWLERRARRPWWLRFDLQIIPAVLVTGVVWALAGAAIWRWIYG